MRLSLAIAAALLAAAPQVALAEPSKADQLFDEGKKLSDAGQWGPACEKFEAAIAIDGDAPGTMLNLGRCNEKLEKIATALSWYEKADEHAAKHNMPDYEAAAQERKTALAPLVPTLRFELAAPLPPGGKIFVDDTEVAPKDQARLPVDPGHRRIDVRAPHKAPIHLEMDVKQRDDLAVPIGAFAAAEIVDPGAARRKQAYIFGGIGAGLFLAQGVVGLSGRFIIYDDGKTHDTWNKTVAPWVLTSVGAVGVVGLAYGAYLYLTAAKPYEADKATAVVPTLAPDSVGMAYVGRF